MCLVNKAYYFVLLALISLVIYNRKSMKPEWKAENKSLPSIMF